MCSFCYCGADGVCSVLEHIKITAAHKWIHPIFCYCRCSTVVQQQTDVHQVCISYFPVAIVAFINWMTEFNRMFMDSQEPQPREHVQYLAPLFVHYKVCGHTNKYCILRKIAEYLECTLMHLLWLVCSTYIVFVCVCVFVSKSATRYGCCSCAFSGYTKK